MSDNIPTLSGEARFTRLAHSTSSGYRLTFEVDAEMYAKFLGREGGRFMLAVAEIGNDEKPTQTAPQEKKQGNQHVRSKWLGQRCSEPKFWEFLYATSEADCKLKVYKYFDIESRATVDMPEHATRFASLAKQYADFCAGGRLRRA